MKEVVFDVETNGLLEQVNKVWVIACKDVDGSNEKLFSDIDCTPYEKSGTLIDGVKYLNKADRLICHNVAGYDAHVFEKFFDDIWKTSLEKLWDTLVQSHCQHYDRPKLKGIRTNHGLEYYGQLLEFPKPTIEDWSYFDSDKVDRVLVDIEINRRTYLYLNEEADKIGLDFTAQIQRTTEAQYWYTKQEQFGWMGDKAHMRKCVDELDEIISQLVDEIEPRLPKQVKPKAVKCTWADIRDKWPNFYRKVPNPKFDPATGRVIKAAYMPTLRVFLKSGKYDKHTASWFDIDTDPKLSNYLVRGPYTKIEIVESKMSQHAIVKGYLLSIGWKPDTWNYEKKDGKFVRDDSGKLIKKSPKLTESSFGSIEGELGKKIADHNTYVHRRRTFKNEKNSSKGWINQLREGSDRIAAGAMAWATSTGRAAQFGIVNVPSSAALYGEEMRRSWTCPDDKILVSVDMDSAQLRLLANYMGDPEFTKAVLEGEEYDSEHNYVGTDAHTFNGRFFGLISESDWKNARETQSKSLIKRVSDARKKAKNGIYALLFGAGDEKFAQTVGFKTSAEGKSVKENYYKKLPKLKALIDSLERQWHENEWRGGGYIEVAGKSFVWCASKNKLLNYLLMGSEGVVQNEAIRWVNPEIRKRKLNGEQLAGMHDELTFEFPILESDEGRGILTEMYGRASQHLCLNVPITGTAQTGRNWLDIH